MAKDNFHGIEYEYDGTVYRFDYTLDSAAAANADGFVLAEIGEKPALMIPKLVYFGLAHNHKGMNRKKAEQIYKSIKGKNAFILALADMYSEAVNALVDIDDEDEGNANWTRT